LNFTSPTNKLVNLDFGWGNATATLRWNHIFKPKLFCNTSLIYNRYDLYNDFKFASNGFSVRSGLYDWNLKSDFTWYAADKHLIKFGANYIFHTFTPGIASGSAGSISFNEEISKQYAHEFAVYALDEWQINHRWSINAGLRGVAFNRVGPFTQEIFDDQNLKTGESIKYGFNESIAFYPRLEPRLNVNYLINEESSIKASYTLTYQFIHLATTSGAQLPVDLWIPSSAKVKPQEANQWAMGYFRNFKNNRYEASAEAYYKKMNNQIEFKPFSRLFLNANLENEMVFGRGEAFGLELFVKKKVKKTP
jgi:outer membrane receptor for monomeric catechols